MKYLITESQLNKAIFRYLNSRNFVQIQTENNIDFYLPSDFTNYQIRYNMDDGSCSINMDLIDEVLRVFTIAFDKSHETIGEWVAETLETEVTKVDVFAKPGGWF